MLGLPMKGKIITVSQKFFSNSSRFSAEDDTDS